jgi:tRNA threonylcarbamoyladenosine biosynthesis protein TsaE
VITVRTAGADQTRAVGAALAAALRPGDVVVLSGELGAGKTTFAQGVAAGLGVTEPVTSPTFVLVRPYECAPPGTAGNPTALRRLLHADLYRLEHTTEVSDLALGELVEEEAAALVEWGDVAAPLLGATVTVALGSGDGDADDDAGDDQRIVTVELPPERAAEARTLAGRLDAIGVGG